MRAGFLEEVPLLLGPWGDFGGSASSPQPSGPGVSGATAPRGPFRRGWPQVRANTPSFHLHRGLLRLELIGHIRTRS